MRRIVIVPLLLAAACATQKSAEISPRPEVLIVQTSTVAQAARHVTGGLPVKYAIRTSNRATVPITLKRIQLQSVAQGAYTLRPTSRPFNVTIAPDSYQDVEFWASAVVEDATIAGANGPVTLRMILHFETPMGPFEEISVQQVNDSTGVSGMPR